MSMTSKFQRFLKYMETTESSEDLHKLAEITRDIYNLENVAYLALNLNGAPYSAVTYDPKWAAHYEAQEYMNIDPVVRGAMQQFHPLDWRLLDWSNKRARQFFKEAVEFGVGRQGYTIPIRGPNGQMALFAINHNSDDDEWTQFIAENANDFLLISHHFHQKALTVVAVSTAVESQYLSPREQNVLTYLGAGFSRSQTAEKLSISEHTLRVYVDAARHKLGALNTTHAVALALSQGIITV